MQQIYLDYNATTPLDDSVREAMEPFHTEVWGNPSSVHQIGRKARALLDDCRDRLAQVFRCIICIRTGEWLIAAEDIEETEIQLARKKGVGPGHFAAGAAREDGRGLKEAYKDELER